MAMRIYLEAKQTRPVDWFPTSFGHAYLVMRDASVVAGSPAEQIIALDFRASGRARTVRKHREPGRRIWHE